MSSRSRGATLAIAPSISLEDRRKAAGDHLSNFSDSSRSAASPRASTSLKMPSTVARTFASLAATSLASRPRFRGLAMSRPSLEKSVPSARCARDDGDYGFTVDSILVSLYKSAGGSHFWQLMPGSLGAFTTSAGSGWIVLPGVGAPSRADLRLSSGRNSGLKTSVTKELGTLPSGKVLDPSSKVSPLQSVTLSAGTQGSGYWMFIAFKSRFFVRISIISLNA